MKKLAIVALISITGCSKFEGETIKEKTSGQRISEQYYSQRQSKEAYEKSIFEELKSAQLVLSCGVISIAFDHKLSSKVFLVDAGGHVYESPEFPHKFSHPAYDNSLNIYRFSLHYDALPDVAVQYELDYGERTLYDKQGNLPVVKHECVESTANFK